MITIVCVFRYDEGTRYTDQDVLLLKKGFSKFLTKPHKFVCLTNKKIADVETIPLISDHKGWWAKLELFRKGLFTTPVFYIDLDMLLFDNIDEVIEKCQGEKFLMLSNHEYSVNKDNAAASGIMYWDGDYSYLWEEFSKKPEQYINEYSKHPRLGDQAFTCERVSWKSFFEIQGFRKEWFWWLNLKRPPHPLTKILIGEGKRKFDNPKYKKLPWVQKKINEIDL